MMTTLKGRRHRYDDSEEYDKFVQEAIQRDFRNMLKLFKQPETERAINHFALELGRSSCFLPLSEAYCSAKLEPREITNEDGQLEMVLVDPLEDKAYMFNQDDDNMKVSFQTLRSGTFDKSIKDRNPSKLPGGKSSVQLLSEHLKAYEGGLVARAEINPFKETIDGEQRIVKKIMIRLIWDLPKYKKELKELQQKQRQDKDARAAPRQKPRVPKTTVMEKPDVDEDGFQAVTPRRRKQIKIEEDEHN